MNYPNRMKVNQNEIIEEKPIQFANRGMDFEKAVNSSNLFYDDQKRAILNVKKLNQQHLYLSIILLLIKLSI